MVDDPVAPTFEVLYRSQQEAQELGHPRGAPEGVAVFVHLLQGRGYACAGKEGLEYAYGLLLLACGGVGVYQVPEQGREACGIYGLRPPSRSEERRVG